MTLLVAIPPIILSLAPFLAQTSGSDAAVAGIAGLMGMLGVLGFVLALIYSIVLFLLPFIVWKCLRRLTSIREDIRGFRQEITALATRMSAASPLLTKEEPNTPRVSLPPGVSFTFEEPG